MTIWITTNGRPSNGALQLAKEPGFKRIRTGKFVKATDIVVNWGSSQELIFPKAQPGKVLNKPNAIKLASNKLDFFSYLFGPESPGYVQTVEWTTDKDVAKGWQDEGCIVVARTILTGHSGEGIIIVEKGEPIPDAPLYTKYIFKKREFRVHVVLGQVVDTQQKIRDPAREPTTWKVRSHANGFIFARNGIVDDPDRDKLAIAATQALGLDFGAVDIIQDKAGVYYVLECNTAPGLEGQTVTSYAEAFRKVALQG